MDKLHEESRKKFEDEYSRIYRTPASVLKVLRDGDDYKWTEGDRLSRGWLMWQASRASIVVELPQRQSLCASSYGEGLYLFPSNSGECMEYDEVVETLRAIGLSIKGE